MFGSLLRSLVSAGAVALLALGPVAAAHAQQPPEVETGPPEPKRHDQPKKPLTEKNVPRAKPKTPLEAALRDGFPTNAVKRARVRDNLYALLATAGGKDDAKRIGRALERIYLTSGSQTIDLLMRRAIKASNAKRYDRALEFLNAVTELAPDFAEGWNRRAYVYYKKNDYHQSAGDLRRVLALDPRHFKALDGLGTILREIGDDAGALAVFEKLVEVNPYWAGAESVLPELRRKIKGRGI